MEYNNYQLGPTTLHVLVEMSYKTNGDNVGHIQHQMFELTV